MSLGANVLPDDDFFDHLMRCQGSRLEDQRSTLPFVPASNGRPPGIRNDIRPNENRNNNAQPAIWPNGPHRQNGTSAFAGNNRLTNNNNSNRGATLPDEDFLSLIMRFQSARIEDQRSNLPPLNNRQRNEQEQPGSGSSSRRSSTDYEDGKKCTKV